MPLHLSQDLGWRFRAASALVPYVDASTQLTLHVSCRFWFFKFLILVGITVGAFYIPDGSFPKSRWL